MIPRECKRLAEVDFPIAEVSKHAVREKSIRHGHPSTLHLWWARRPLASCRAMLLALLLPDPCDPLCPEEFREKARALLRPLPNMSVLTDDDKGLQRGLLRFIADFANWELSTNQTYLEVGRGLVKAAHPEETPLVVDPFAGGGSIPLEALRLGCEAFASDLNPVACLILKVMLEDLPRHGADLADELRGVGAHIKAETEKELAEFYPKGPDGATPIAYLWARTVRCEAPGCGAEVPLMRSFWLCKKPTRRRALDYEVIRCGDQVPKVEFRVMEPRTEAEVSPGTVARSNARCLACGNVLPRTRVQAQMIEAKGGADTARLMVVVVRTEQGNLEYRRPREHDAVGISLSHQQMTKREATDPGKYRIDEPLPYLRSIFNVNVYGVHNWGQLFTTRQRLALLTFADVLVRVLARDNLTGSAQARVSSMVLSRMADYMTSICRWDTTQERAVNTYCRQALGMVWDFAEIVPCAHTVGSWDSMLSSVSTALRRLVLSVPQPGTAVQCSATLLPLPEDSAHITFTDPPYYDAVPYSNLSDFFVVWLRRTLGPDGLPGLIDGLSPKDDEIVQLAERNVAYRHKTRAFFEERIALAFGRCLQVQHPDGVCCVVFAHKETDSWEALLGALVSSQWKVVASWPIQTEQRQRLRARDSAALATSVHLVCRPRLADAPVGDWANVLRELPVRVGDWIERLQGEGVRGADLIFACIGPALEIYSRYRRVETADGREVPLAEYLEKVWEVVGRTALGQILGTAEARARNGMAGALEEDARLTAVFLWTLQSTNGNNKKDEIASQVDSSDGDEPDTSSDNDDEVVATSAKARGQRLIYDMVIRFTRPLGIDLEKWDGRIVDIEKGVVRLIPVMERAKQLFGDDVAATVLEIERGSVGVEQLSLFPETPVVTPPPAIRAGRRGRAKSGAKGETNKTVGPTTLDRVHAAMLLQASGQANALRALLTQEQDRGPEFLRLANALSALYPREGEEKRLLDAMLLAVPR